MPEPRKAKANQARLKSAPLAWKAMAQYTGFVKYLPWTLQRRDLSFAALLFEVVQRSQRRGMAVRATHTSCGAVSKAGASLSVLRRRPSMARSLPASGIQSFCTFSVPSRGRTSSCCEALCKVEARATRPRGDSSLISLVASKCDC